MFADFVDIQAGRQSAGQPSTYFDFLKLEHLLYDSHPIRYTTFTILILFSVCSVCSIQIDLTQSSVATSSSFRMTTRPTITLFIQY